MRKKHRNDQNHGKDGWQSGNPRYSRKKPNKKRSMKGLKRN